jgi:hypothetical protein
MIEIAKQIDHVPFNLLRDRHTFCMAPVKNDNKTIIENFVIMAEDFVRHNKGIIIIVIIIIVMIVIIVIILTINNII